MSNWYAHRDALKTRMNFDASEDAVYDAILEAVSRQIDTWTGRQFFARTATRTLSTPRTDRVLVPDLLAVTSLKTDTDGDLSYGTTWATTDYVLLPSDAPLESPPRPYWELRTAPSGVNSFGTGLHNVQIAGRWGFYEVLERATSLLAAAVATTTAVTITVDDGAEFHVGQTLLIDSEQVFITGIVDDNLTVQRGRNGTTAATHLDNAVLDVYTYPVLSEACLLQAGHLYQSTKAPSGIIGGSDFGPIRIAAFQPLVRMMLQPFKLPHLADSHGH